jgi:hypothetical protein
MAFSAGLRALTAQYLSMAMHLTSPMRAKSAGCLPNYKDDAKPLLWRKDMVDQIRATHQGALILHTALARLCLCPI